MGAPTFIVERGMIASCRVLAFVVLLAARTPTIAQETARMSVDSSGVEANGDSWGAAISGDGRFVAFQSYSTNLVVNDTNGTWDVFVHDRTSGATDRASVDSFGNEGNASSYSAGPSLSADGRFVAFGSIAWNLVFGDTNSVADVFVHDRSTGVTERVSVDSSGSEGNADSDVAKISADGRYVAFHSFASNLVAGDTNGTGDVFIHDRSNGVTERISVDSFGAEGDALSLYPAISADGRFVAFQSDATNLVSGDSNALPDAFVHDRDTGATERISVDSFGLQANGASGAVAVSADGRIVAFVSDSSNLVAGDSNGSTDAFVHDRSAGATSRVSVDSSGGEGNARSVALAMSSDGRCVTFFSDASNLVPFDTNLAADVFVHDQLTGLTERVSVDSSGTEAIGSSAGALGMSADGGFVAFQCWASNLVGGDGNNACDVFVHERCIVDATWSSYGAGFPGTNGVPSLTAESSPVLGSSVKLDLANSSGNFTVGLLFIGFQQTSLHSALGGDLFVVPALTSVIGLAPSGMSLTGDIPYDGSLCGFEIDLQALESDPGATKGVSFTQGLELVLGR
jgi:Tol biopolymer transport system component